MIRICSRSLRRDPEGESRQDAADQEKHEAEELAAFSGGIDMGNSKVDKTA